jgi:beta-lactamase superfamily II metal-dependent hydrolase
MEEHIGKRAKINVFICSHRDSDHMRGVKRVHKKFPIQHIWDSGAVGTTPTCTEYLEYMELRRSVGCKEVKARKKYDYGNTRLRIMNSKNDNLPDDPNAQSIVIKVVQRNGDDDLASVPLTGDTDAATWKDIRKKYDDAQLDCSLLLASHHGSITYFDDPIDDTYYTSHLRAKSPDMTIVSVGDNGHGHPDKKALEYYEKYSTGSSQGNKLYRTDKQGHIRVKLKSEGGWKLHKEKG